MLWEVGYGVHRPQSRGVQGIDKGLKKGWPREGTRKQRVAAELPTDEVLLLFALHNQVFGALSLFSEG